MGAIAFDVVIHASTDNVCSAYESGGNSDEGAKKGEVNSVFNYHGHG